MKFAQYLEDTQTPEWKKAYIDYRGLKKRITAIRRADEASRVSGIAQGYGTPTPGSPLLRRSDSRPYGTTGLTPSAQEVEEVESIDQTAHAQAHFSDEPSPLEASASQKVSTSISRPDQHRAAPRRSTSIFANLARTASNQSYVTPLRERLPQLSTPLPLATLLPLLPSVHREFFEFLDHELEKIENFYIAREDEARERVKLLKQQLAELKDHRRLFYEQHPPDQSTWKVGRTSAFRTRLPFRSLPIPDTLRARSPVPPIFPRSHPGNGKGRDVDNVVQVEESRTRELDPDEYQHAKRKLKKAVIEFYRGLDVLYNYRIMNLTGFRKALKKYEKVTKIKAQQSYMSEKVEASALQSGDVVHEMKKEMEELFAARFEKGDKKRAMARLRAGDRQRSHHFSTFRTGFMLGLAIPALISGLYQSFQQVTRDAVPSWDVLLFVYSILLVPVLFALLVGINLLVWSQSRINYVFIFELDVRSRLDHREYFELPSFLLATLCGAFWLSFARVGSDNIAPTSWPLIWLVFAVVIMLNPIPVFFKDSRWWLARKVSKLLASGVHRVEFTDFWMGDQFCSLIFTLSNMYFFFCVYADGFENGWGRCSKPAHWALPFVLGILPLLSRFVQSIRRYADSRLITHLINGGKYASGILYYFCYFFWRHRGARGDYSLVLLCLSGSCYALYAGAWDILMDWSLLKSNPRHLFLRPELVYTNHISLYYFAVVSNMIVRFIWIIYVPVHGPSFPLRTFIAAMLEMLRRIQWNFYRLENEHVGNVDQYRVTREVPLPYQFDDTNEHDREDGDEDGVSLRSSWIKRRRSRVSARSHDSESQL